MPTMTPAHPEGVEGKRVMAGEHGGGRLESWVELWQGMELKV